MMKIHSREWFLQQVAATKTEISEQWPSWMKEGKMVAVASLPRIGEGPQTNPIKGAGKKSNTKQVV